MSYNHKIYHILIIDDSIAETHFLQTLLEKKGYQISVACNGREGVQVATAQSPDLILMDVVMPELNGFQATRELKKLFVTKNIPIIIYSVRSQETDRIWAIRQGAKDYLVKPANEKTLLTTINKYLIRE